MKKLVLVTMLMLIAAAAFAAQQYYNFPTATTIRDDARILIYNNNSSQNITGLQLKQETAAYAHLSSSRNIANATQIFNLMTTATANKLVKRAASGASPYARVFEIKNGLGKIVQYIVANGMMVFGTPVPLQITEVYPANGATNVSNGTWFNYTTAGLGWQRMNATTPSVTYNKQAFLNFSSTAVISSPISQQYIVGSSIAPRQSDETPAIWRFANFSGAAGATYTMKVVRGSIVQTDGETTSSCSALMPDVAGLCVSTFTMR